MFGTRAFLTVCLALFLMKSSPAAPTILGKKPKTEAQVKRLTETLRTDPDEKTRRAAITELREADPRTHADVIPSLISALQRDASVAVRAEAAEAIGQYKLIYPLAGLALEAAAELDPSRAVRDSAQQALWEYHLVGYRSPRGVNGIAGQTAEPPIARPSAHHRPPVQAASGLDIPIPQAMPAAKPLRPAAELPALAPPPPASHRPILSLPMLNSPALARRPVLDTISLLKSALPKGAEKAPEATATPEPPLAPRRVLASAPPPRPQGTRMRAAIVTSQPFALPSVSEPPGEFPSAVRPMPAPPEPPLAPPARPIQ